MSNLVLTRKTEGLSSKREYVSWPINVVCWKQALCLEFMVRTEEGQASRVGQGVTGAKGAEEGLASRSRLGSGNAGQGYAFEELLRPIYKQIAENQNAEIFSANTLLYKEETIDAVMAAKDAAEKSLRLADLRSSRLTYSMVVDLGFRSWFM
ncbi:hypothetical protein POM88_031018 [Heracleum sosnowskyi]|uniref:Uncharacterized protein n=1 Tax=Heracleum sosnowskyi TaxID=360622 RepID=A0AAD8HWZ8_9APIA|nr:hypothetical protein POM88_031018 [Heracleum sosnowskyi]